MQLIYINKTFVRLIDSKKTDKASRVLSEALFYDEQKKTWQSPYSHTDRSRLDFTKNENEFLEKKWILLKKLENEFVQEGPFSSLEIFDLISQSVLRLEDPIWKEGFSKWMPIKQTTTFNELCHLLNPIHTDVADILSSVVDYQPEMRRVEDENPSPGAPGEVFIILDDK